MQNFFKGLVDKIFTVQSRLKIARKPNFDSTSNHRAAPSTRMKTNMLVWLKDKISIQFEDQLCSCTPRNLKIVDDGVLLDLQDGLDYSLHRYFQHVLCTVEDTCALLHENQGVAYLDLGFHLCLEIYAKTSYIGLALQV